MTTTAKTTTVFTARANARRRERAIVRWMLDNVEYVPVWFITNIAWRDRLVSSGVLIESTKNCYDPTGRHYTERVLERGMSW